MKQGLGLELRQELKLHPQLILTLKLLPLTTVELEGLVRQELEENPVLEERAEASDSEPAAADDFAPDSPEAESLAGQEFLGDSEQAPDELGGSTEFLDLVPDDGFLAATFQPSAGGENETDAIDLAAAEGPGVVESLMPELRAVLSEEDARIAELVLESLDDDGFLAVPEEELALNHGLEIGRLRAVLYHIQRVEPGGIACLDQRSALLVQLELHGHGPETFEYRMIEQCWQALLQLQLGRVARLLKTDVESVKAAAVLLVGLEPRPGRRYSCRPTEYVAPDFSVFWRDNRICADYNDDRIPRLRLARRFVDILRNPRAFPPEQVDFARQKYQRAVMLLKAIESRRLTLERLIRVVVREQEDFFRHGPEHLKPATLKDAAAELGVHPSTVSRASANKYVETDYGIFPLKHFFKAGAGDKSRASIKELIRNVIEKESPDDPLSDDQIGARLQEQGVKISRRTVAKYRGELGIPGRNQRGRL